MKKVRVLLAYFTKEEGLFEPLGIECLAGHLNKEFGGHIVLQMEWVRNQPELNQFLKRLSGFSPDILALSLNFNTLDFLEVTLGYIARLGLNPRIICGNVVASFNAEHLLASYPGVIISRGSGEAALAGLVKNVLGDLAISAVPNIVYMEGGVIQRTETVPSPMGAPVRRFFKEIRRSTQGKIYLEASRGCPYACGFCAQRIFFDHTRVEKEPAILFEEIRDLSRKAKGRIRLLDFIDEDLLADPETALAVASTVSLLKSDGILGNKTSIMCSLSVRSLLSAGGAEVLEKLVSAGLDRCFVGVESFLDCQLERFDKSHTATEALQALEMLTRKKVYPDVGLIMFDPETNLKEIVANCQSIKRYGATGMISNPFHQWKALVGTKMCGRLMTSGLVKEEYDPNWLTYDWFYAEQQVAEVVAQAKEFERLSIAAQAGIKAIFRSENFNRLSNGEKRHLAACKTEQNLIFLNFLEEAAFARINGGSQDFDFQKHEMRINDFLAKLARCHMRGLKYLQKIAKTCLLGKRANAHNVQKLLLPQDEPKGCLE